MQTGRIKMSVEKEYRPCPVYIQSWYEENRETEENHL
jgi:hypothetical protein